MASGARHRKTNLFDSLRNAAEEAIPQQWEQTPGFSAEIGSFLLGFPSMVPQMIGLYLENPTNMDDLGVPLFWETSSSKTIQNQWFVESNFCIFL